MATATFPQPTARKRLWTFDEMAAELPETNLPTELWDGEINWIVDPEAQTMEVFALEKGAFKLASRAEQSDTATSKLLSGFTVAWAQLLL